VFEGKQTICLLLFHKTQRDVLHQITELFYPLNVGVEAYCWTWTHKDTPHSVGLLWTRFDQSQTILKKTHKTLTRDSHTPGGIRTRNPGNRAAAFNFKELLSLNLLF